MGANNIRIITVNLPETYINALKGLIGNDGFYPSRSELIRVAVREYLIKELGAVEALSEFKQKYPKTARIYPVMDEKVPDSSEFDRVLSSLPKSGQN